MTVPTDPLRLRWCWHAVGAVLVLFIAVMSLSPADAPYLVFTWWDKLMHFTGYGVVAAWYAAFVYRRNLLRVLLALVAMGAAIEIAQQVIPGRGMEALDALANSLGAACGTLLGLTPWRHGLHVAERCLLGRGTA